MIDKPDVRLMHRRSGLQRLPRLLVGQANSSQFSQLFVYKRKQLVRRVGIALLDLVEDLSNVGHGRNFMGSFTTTSIANGPSQSSFTLSDATCSAVGLIRLFGC